MGTLAQEAVSKISQSTWDPGDPQNKDAAEQ